MIGYCMLNPSPQELAKLFCNNNKKINLSAEFLQTQALTSSSFFPLKQKFHCGIKQLEIQEFNI